MFVFLHSNNRVALGAAIRDAVPGDGRVHLDVRYGSRPPWQTAAREPGLVVIDLTSDGAILPCVPPMGSAANPLQYVMLVTRTQSLPVCWVDFARRENVELVSVNAGEADRYSALVVAVLRRAGDRDVARLAGTIVNANPCLHGCDPIVAAVLTYPWQVRTPRDVSRVGSISRRALRERCRALGLRRVEHLITLIRWVAFEHLRNTEHLSSRRARLTVGISDPSNFRRQVRRVRGGWHAVAVADQSQVLSVALPVKAGPAAVLRI